MANRNIKGITIEIDGNPTPLQNALKKVDSSLKTTQTNLKDINKLLKLDPSNTELLTQKQKNLESAIKDTKSRLDKLNEAQGQVSKGSAEWDAIQREIIDTEQKLEQLEQDYRDFGSVAKQQLKAVGDKFANVGDKIKGVGEKLAPVSAAAAGLGGVLLKLGYDAASNADELNTLSKQTGISTDELQKMQYAADLVDVSVEDITGALKKMKQKMDPANKAFQDLGVSVTNSDGSMRNATDVFYDTLEALSEIPNETERDQAAMEIFGRSADDLAGIVDDGGEAFKGYGEEAEDLGLILDGKTLDSLNETNDTFDRLKQTVSKSLGQVGADVAEVLGPAIEQIAGWIGTLMEKLRELSPEQMEMILKIVAVAAALAPVIIIIGNLVTGIGGIISVLGTVVGVLGGPVTLAIGAVIAVGVLLYKNWDKICEWAGKLRDFVVEAWGKLKDKVVNFVTNLKDKVSEKWQNLKDTVSNLATNIKDKAVSAFETARSTVSEKVASLKNAVSEKFSAMRDAVADKMASITQKNIERWNEIKTAVGPVLQHVVTNVTGKFLSIRNTIADKLASARDTVINIFGAIKDGIQNKLNAAKTFVSNVIEKIKSFFHFDWSLPKIKLPHFSITGKFSLTPPQVPHLSVEWYRQGGIFTSPTIFSTPYGYKGVGEAGAEAVLPLDQLWSHMTEMESAIIRSNQSTANAMYNAMIRAFSEMSFSIGNREFARILRDHGAI